MPSWVSVALASVVGLSGWAAVVFSWRRRSRPTRIAVKEVLHENNFVRLVGQVSAGKVQVLLDGKPVSQPSKARWLIYNEGSTVLRDVKIDFHFVGCTPIVRAIDPGGNDCNLSALGHQLEIHFPYMNPKREHKAQSTLDVLADGPLDRVEISGYGPGWSVHTISVEQIVRRWGRRVVALSAMLAGVGGVGFYLVDDDAISAVFVVLLVSSFYFGFIGLALLFRRRIPTFMRYDRLFRPLPPK